MKTKNRSGMRYLLMCIMTAALCYGSLATAADPDFTDVFAAGVACDFPLQIEGWGGNRHFKEFADENGNIVRTLNAGTGSALRFTNLSNEETLSTKSNGAVVHTSYDSDGSSTWTLTGHNILILFPSDVPAGPSTTLIVGSVVFTVDLNGVFTVQKVSGNETDICDALS